MYARFVETNNENNEYMVALKRAVGIGEDVVVGCSTSEAVQGTSLPLQRVDDVHGGDGLALGMFAVSDGVTDNVLEEQFQDTAHFLVDEARDALDTTSASQTANGGLGDALDVVAKDLAMTLGAALSESLASLSTS